MATKIITLDDHFSTGEPTVQLVSTRGRSGLVLRESTSLHKIASTNSPALDYINTIEPEPGKSIVLVVGLGDHETYGPNRNGDGFPSEAVPGKISSDQVLPKHHKSYENALVFEHHANSDPKKAIGSVKKAFWNPEMRRVEVVEDFIHSKAPHLLEKIASGEFPAKSMGCFKGDAPVHVPTGLQAIQDIEVGDIVLTHTGQWKPVTELHRRQYVGKFFSVRTATGISNATSEHPYAVLPRTEVEEYVREKGYWRRKDTASINVRNAEWMPAEALETGDYLLTPFNMEVEETLTVAECRFLGYYGSEGHTYHHSGSGVIFSHHVDDVLPVEMCKLGQELGFTFTSHKHNVSTFAQNTRLASADLAALCEKHVGNYAHEKTLSPELMRQPKEQQLAFLGAYLNGDGGSKSTGDFYISTCNRSLAYQLQHMGFRCGMYSKVNTLEHGPSTVVDRPTTEFQVSFVRRNAAIIAPYTEKVAAHVMKGSSTGPFFVGNVVVSKIKDISVSGFTGPVYNLEVEDDNSFVADNHAVHNCRIKYDVCTLCGNRAKTRADYCDHLKYEMNKIYPDGKQAAALNPSPDFFDSSWVLRPADRTGYMLKKVARDNTAYEIRTASFDLGELAERLQSKAAAIGKAADIEKVISAEPKASVSSLTNTDQALLRRYSDNVAKPAASEARPLSSKAMKIVIEYTPSEAQTTLDAMGMPMGLSELMRYFFGRMGGEGDVSPDLCRSLNKHAEVIYDIYSEYPRFLEEIETLANIQPAPANEKLARSFTEWARDEIVGETPWREESRPRTDMLTYKNPRTGQQLATTVGAVRKTEGDLYKQKLEQNLPVLGAAALLAPVTGGLASAGLAAGGAYHALKEPKSPMIRTQQGPEISGYTEMVPKTAGLAPELRYVMLRAHDYATQPLAQHEKEAILRRIKTAEISDEKTPLLGPTLDLNKVCAIIGESLYLHRS